MSFLITCWYVVIITAKFSKIDHSGAAAIANLVEAVTAFGLPCLLFLTIKFFDFALSSIETVQHHPH